MLSAALLRNSSLSKNLTVKVGTCVPQTNNASSYLASALFAD